MTILNIGILAHVDAGKTSVTESLLYQAGTIQEKGKVDQGNTVTDGMLLEKQRGITIKASTVATNWQGNKINIIDTPGHMDFISEVERSFSVLDGAILVISANEGVQEQTRVIYKKLQELAIPTIVFINKIDLPYVDIERVLEEIRELLHMTLMPLEKKELTSAQEDFILNQSDSLAERYLNNEPLTTNDYQTELTHLIAQGQISPYYLGSAIKNQGITALLDGISTYFKPAETSTQMSGYVYKITHDDRGKKRLYLRLFGSGIRYGERVTINRTQQQIKLKNIAHLHQAQVIACKQVMANDILVLTDVANLQIGDIIGVPLPHLQTSWKLLPTIKAALTLNKKEERPRLLEALDRLTIEDPTLNFQIDTVTNDIVVMLYGDIQKQVLTAYLRDQFQLEVTLGPTQLILKERIASSTSARVEMTQAPNPYWASIGLRCEPLPYGTGNQFKSDVSLGYLTKSFQHAVRNGLTPALNSGLYGWELIDTAITLEFAEFASAVSAPSDFRKLAPYVLWLALEKSNTVLQEPYVTFELYVPQVLTSRVLTELQKIGVSIKTMSVSGLEHCLTGEMTEQKVRQFQPTFISITNGKGLLATQLKGYTAVENQGDYDITFDTKDQLRVLFKKANT